MKKYIVAFLSAMILSFIGNPASAGLIDITSEGLDHFATFTNDSPYYPVSYISHDPAASGYGDFGWHQHYDNTFPDYAGIHLDGTPYAVTTLRFQVHYNPFRDFKLQASNDSTTGLDGVWVDIFSSTVTNRRELTWQEWAFENSTTYSWYRIEIVNDYTPGAGWAMYRWELLAEDSTPVPEPATMLLLGSGLLGLAGFRKRSRT
jgi:PEP-CTERM motif-containing protein